MHTRPTRILLLEDEPGHAEAIRRALTATAPDTRVTVVASLAEARAAIAADPPEMLLADRLLPDGRADELLTSPPEDGAFPVVVMTSHGDESVAVSVLKAGAIDYLVKTPESFALMSHGVERAWREWRLRLEHSRSVRMQALTGEVLGILNDTPKVADAIRRMVSAIRSALRADAVAIRLRQGDDYPYVATEGFPGAFVEAETHLAVLDRDGNFCLDERGHPLLSCTCGLVLTGAQAGGAGLLSPGGSAWTNDGGLELGSLEKDPRIHPRNLCLHEGYKSVALIPIRSARQIVGLLQINHRGPGLFSQDTIRYLEGIGASFGVALARQQDVEGLRRGEAMLRALVNAIPESLVMVDRSGTLVVANPTAARRVGFEPAEVLGRNVFDVLPPDVAGRRRAWLAEVFESGRPIEREDELLDRLMRLHLSPVIDDDGRVTHVVSIGFDVTDQRQMERRILKERSRLQMALQAAKAGAFEWDVRYDTVTWSPEMYGLFGVAPGNRPSMALWRRLMHPDDAGQAESGIARAFDTGFYDEEFRLVWDDGSTHWIAARGAVTYDEDGKPIVVTGINLDITERRTMEAALKETTERYRSLVETSSDWIWEIDADGRYTYASERVEALLGYTPKEIVGRSPFDLMPPDEAERVGRIFHESSRTRSPFVGLENVNLRKDGSAVVLETSGVPIFAPDGTFQGYRGMDRDITERKTLESQLRQAQKLEAVGELAGGIAHDFNNILAATMMHTELLRTNPKLDEDTQQSLGELAAEVERAARLTRQLLLFSRRSVMTKARVDTNEVVSNLLKMLQRLIGEQIDMRFEAGGRLPLIEADTGMLEQCVLNLVVNARDAMPDGGRVTIATEMQELTDADRPLHPARRAGTFVRLSVTDSGSGIDEQTLARIFEPFFTTKDVGKGTGLGLSTVHGIVAQHKGWIEVDTEVGRGTRFDLYFPGASGETVAARAAPPTAPGGGHETVLVVEDEDMLRDIVTRALERLGYRVFSAANGREAVALWQTCAGQVDLLLTDMVMPEGMTGLELSERLREMKPSLRTIISSGYSAHMVDTGVTTRSGIVYLPKPYNLGVLATVVRECLDRP